MRNRPSKESEAARMREWRANNPGRNASQLRAAYWRDPEAALSKCKERKVKHKETMLARKFVSDIKKFYGLSLDDYEQLLQWQDGCCAICRGLNPSLYRLAVDHDHETGKVRGLLCSACNTGIGQFKEFEDRMLAAIQYLRDNKKVGYQAAA